MSTHVIPIREIIRENFYLPHSGDQQKTILLIFPAKPDNYRDRGAVLLSWQEAYPQHYNGFRMSAICQEPPERKAKSAFSMLEMNQ